MTVYEIYRPLGTEGSLVHLRSLTPWNTRIHFVCLKRGEENEPQYQGLDNGRVSLFAQIPALDREAVLDFLNAVDVTLRRREITLQNYG